MTVGILAVQGDFEAHRKMLESLGVSAREVRRVADLDGLHALVLPGGESTTQLKFLQNEGLAHALGKFAEQGGALFGTCAGAILLAKDVQNPPQASLGLLDVTVLRNGYGRQLASEVRFGPSQLKQAPLEMVFIRAPIIERTGRDVQILAEDRGRPVLVRQARILAATFHPELTDDPSVHHYFLEMVGERAWAA
ncbi:MAG TPA: pyridoxal 5'-phosphate synthase glutaminase subunit PdxT [Candidatus Acidoferrales bacterium]|nr:pyridoxal 5'-phosphate synthase glutaminase subunit PdxT [Candidatus Acidoferrales bacterium]